MKKSDCPGVGLHEQIFKNKFSNRRKKNNDLKTTHSWIQAQETLRILMTM